MKGLHLIRGTVALAALVGGISVLGAIGDVLSFIPASTQDPWGIGWDGTNLWHSDRVFEEIQELTTAGVLVSRFSTDGLDNNPRGVAWDGSSLWFVGRQTRTIYNVDTAGNLISSFPVNGIDTDPRGLTWDGSSLWLVGGQNTGVFQIGTTGTLLSSFSTIAFEDNPIGLAWDGTSLWLSGDQTDSVYELSPTGAVRSSFSVLAIDDRPRDTTWDGCSLWMVGRRNKMISRLSTGTTGTIASTDPIQPGDVITLTLIDDDLNTDSGTAESLILRTTNTTTGEFEDRTYVETGVDSGVFTATVATVLAAGAGTDNDGVFNVQVGDALTTFYSDARTECGTSGSATATTNVTGPALMLTKTASVATAVPGGIITYSVVHTNNGSVSVLPGETIDPVPPDTDYQVGSASFSAGTSGITAVIEFSNNGGSTYTHAPVSGGGGAPPGFDRDVTHIRYTYVGTLTNTSPDNTFDVDFSVRVR